MRTWAAQDDDARVTQQRVDATRIAYLQSLWLQITGDDMRAADMGRMLNLLLIGAHHVVPPLTAGEMRRLCEVSSFKLTREPASDHAGRTHGHPPKGHHTPPAHIGLVLRSHRRHPHRHNANVLR